MKTTLEKITPEIAQKYLTCVDPKHQRKRSNARVDAFKREMIAGHWYQNHQGIAFDDQGRLIDGQHRLAAIKESGATITMLVSRGIASEMVNGIKLYAIDTIDVGYKRTTGEQLSLRHGIENANRVAAACRSILHWSTGIHKNTTAITLEILAIYPLIKKLASVSMTNRHLTGVVIGCLAVAQKAFPQLNEEFIKSFVSGVGLRKGSPSLLLRNYLINNSTKTGSGGGEWRVTCWCFNVLKAAALKEEIKQIKSGDAGVLFFRQQQKNNVRKIQAAAGLTENQEEDKDANH